MNQFKKMPLPRNPFATLTLEQTREKYYRETDDPQSTVMAYGANDYQIPLVQTCNFVAPIEFIAGLWRIQDISKQTEFYTLHARDKDFIVHSKLSDTTNGYTYYSATLLPLAYNCYGPLCLNPDYILANLHTHWGYGRDIKSAAAFLSRKLADVYRPAINVAIELEKIKTL